MTSRTVVILIAITLIQSYNRNHNIAQTSHNRQLTHKSPIEKIYLLNEIINKYILMNSEQDKLIKSKKKCKKERKTILNTDFFYK